MKARLLADSTTVELFDGDYRDRFPAESLGAKLRFYRGLRDRDARPGGGPGPYHRFYQPTVEALERVEKMVKIMAGSVKAAR